MDLEKNDAQWQCEQFILQSLDDPYKAIFEYFGMFPAEKNADGAYNVTATLQIDENAPKKKSVCTLKKTGPEQWQLVGIKELP